MKSIIGELLCFKKDKIAIISDVVAMFYQVRVAAFCDRDALRFFWWPEGDLDVSPAVYRKKVHFYRAQSFPSCSSYCLCQTAKASKYFDPKIRELVRTNFYVDDCLVSVKNEKHAVKIIKDLRSLLAYGGLKLTKWLSNSEEAIKTISEDHFKISRNFSVPPVTTKKRVLGVSWCVIKDEFFFEIDLPKIPAIKKRILSVTNSLYDLLLLPDSFNVDVAYQDFGNIIKKAVKKTTPRGYRNNYMYIPCWHAKCKSLYRTFLQSP